MLAAIRLLMDAGVKTAVNSVAYGHRLDPMWRVAPAFQRHDELSNGAKPLSVIGYDLAADESAGAAPDRSLDRRCVAGGILDDPDLDRSDWSQAVVCAPDSVQMLGVAGLLGDEGEQCGDGYGWLVGVGDRQRVGLLPSGSFRRRTSQSEQKQTPSPGVEIAKLGFQHIGHGEAIGLSGHHQSFAHQAIQGVANRCDADL